MRLGLVYLKKLRFPKLFLVTAGFSSAMMLLSCEEYQKTKGIFRQSRSFISLSQAKENDNILYNYDTINNNQKEFYDIQYKISYYEKFIHSKLMKSTSIASYNANNPIEDRVIFEYDENTNNIYVGVFDGHGGWQMAEFAQKNIIQILKQEIFSRSTASNDPNNIQHIMDGLKNTFLRIDRDFMKLIHGAFKLGFGDVAKTGACAIFSVINLNNNNIIVANAGDSRAVLGQEKINDVKNNNEFNKIEAIPLSNDHNAKMENEIKKLMKEHPNEIFMDTTTSKKNGFNMGLVRCKIKNSCYVKGVLQPTRSLGDYYLKYSEFNGPPYSNNDNDNNNNSKNQVNNPFFVKNKHDRSRGRHISEPYSPPYIAANPEIITYNIHNQENIENQFLIIGSDGVWDFLTNEEAVEIVLNVLNDESDKDIGQEMASKEIIRKILEKSAQMNNLTLKELLHLPSGDKRRSLHDDITVAIVFLK